MVGHDRLEREQLRPLPLRRQLPAPSPQLSLSRYLHPHLLQIRPPQQTLWVPQLPSVLKLLVCVSHCLAKSGDNADVTAAEAPTGSTGAAESTASGTTGGTTTGADDTTGTTNGTTTGTTGTDDTTGTSNSTSSGTDSGSAGTGSGPIGIGWDSEFNKADLTTYKAAGLQWWYNWQLQPSEGVESIVEFVPMVWGKANVPELAGALASWTDDIQYVLSFNERTSLSFWLSESKADDAR